MKESTVECITENRHLLLGTWSLVTLGRTVFTQNIEFSPMINSPSQAAKVLAKAVAKVAARNLNSDL